MNNNLKRAELAQFNADFSRYFAAQHEAERIDEAKRDYVKQALEDAALFRTLSDDYEIVDVDLVQRMLRNFEPALKELASLNDYHKCHSVHALMSCLNIMSNSTIKACHAEIDQAEDRK